MLHSKNWASGEDVVSVLAVSLALRCEGGISFSRISSTGFDDEAVLEEGLGGSR